MDDTAQIKDGSRVKLRGHIGPEFYDGMAKTGNEGWITQHRVDRHGLPEVYIQWDRTHWADNDQPDRWTYEEHFDLIEEPKMAEDLDPAELAQAVRMYRIMKAMQEDGGVSSAPPAPAFTPPESEPELDVDAEQRAHYDANAEKARQLIDKGEAFFMIAVARVDHDEAPLGELRVGIAASSITPESDILIGSQLSSFAARFHEDSAMMNIHHLTQGEDGI